MDTLRAKAQLAPFLLKCHCLPFYLVLGLFSIVKDISVLFTEYSFVSIVNDTYIFK